MNRRFLLIKFCFFAIFALSTLNLKAQIQVSVSTNQPSCNGYTNGDATATPSGGTAPYSYSWSNGQGGQTTYGLAAGNYKVIVSDAAGKSAIKDVVVTQPAAVVAIATPQGGACNASASYVGSAAGGASPYTFKWKNLTTGVTINGANLTTPSVGSYFLEATDSKGCSSSKVVNIAGLLSVTIKVGDVVCGGTCDGAAEAIVTGGTQPYTYFWSYQGKTTQSIFPLPGGSYTVTVTDANGCQKVATGSVFEGEPLKANVTSSGNCTGNASAKVSPTGGKTPYIVKWSTGATGTSVTGLAQGIYFVTVTDAAGCVSDGQVNVSKFDPIHLMFIKKDATCSGLLDGRIEACIPGGGLGPYAFKWSNGATTQIISNVAPGTYSLTVTDAAGCKDSSTTAVINTTTLSLNTTNVNSLCNGSTGIASVTTVTGGTAPYTYKWSNGQTTQTASNLPAGNYLVSVTDALGCTVNGQANVQTNAISVALTKTDAACSGVKNGTATAQVNGGGTGFTYIWSNGATTQTINNLEPGSYKVTVSGVGCRDSSTITIINAATLTLNTTTANSLCNGSTGSATAATVAGGIAPFTYKWSNGQTTQTASNLPGGNYSVSVTDALGCTVSGQASVQVNPISVALTKTDAACSGVKNGIATAQVNGGGIGFTYMWSNGATTQTINNLEPGTYKVIVSGAGCKDSSTITIANAATLKLNTTAVNALCNGITGSATAATVTGGTAPFTYKWSNGQTTQTASNLPGGNYSVSVTDALGCTVSGQASVQVNAISVAINKTDAACSGVKNGTATAQVAGSGTGFTYIWSNGATTSSINNLEAGTYKVIVSGAGCKDSSTITIANAATLSLTTNAVNALCNGSTGSATAATVTGGTAPLTYKWSNGATTQTASNLPTGNYTVTVTDAVGCQVVSNPVGVNKDNSTITATRSVTDATCGQKNGKVQFVFAGGTAPYTVKWSGGTNTDNLAGGAYTYTVTDANGCQSTQNVNIANKGGVTASFTANPTTNSGKCDSINYKFTNTSTGAITGATYKWLFSDNRTSTVTNPDVTFGGTSGDARLITISADGCSDTSRQVFNLNILKADVQDTATTCQNTPVSVLAKNNNPNFPVTYKWTPPSLITAGATTANPSISPTAAGRNVVYVEITNALGCTIKDSVVVTSINKSALNPTDVSFKQDCNTRKISFTNNSAIANQYRWVFGDPSNPTAGSDQKNPTYTYTQAGTVTVTLIPLLGCLDTVRLQVPVRNGTAVSLTANNDSIVCNANVLNFKATATNNAKIEWSTNRNFIPLSTGTDFSATPTGRSNIYYIRATDANGCAAFDSIIINNFAINVSFTKTLDACKGVGKPLTVTNQTPDILTVLWTPATLIDGSNTVLSPNVKTNVDGTLAVKITNQYGCTLSDNVAVKAHEVDAKATISASVIYVDDKVVLNAEPTGTGYTYKWLPATDITTPNAATSNATPKTNTTYVVEVTDAFGCKDTASVSVNVLTPQCSEPFVFIPRAFSPNGDGLNDKVFVRGEYLIQVEFAIYNRWGERVFFTTSMENGWDGTFNGKAVSPDVYGYYVKGICKKGETFFSKGNITVMK